MRATNDAFTQISILNLAAYRVERFEEGEHDYHVYAETAAPRFECE